MYRLVCIFAVLGISFTIGGFVMFLVGTKIDKGSLELGGLIIFVLGVASFIMFYGLYDSNTIIFHDTGYTKIQISTAKQLIAKSTDSSVEFTDLRSYFKDVKESEKNWSTKEILLNFQPKLTEEQAENIANVVNGMGVLEKESGEEQ